MRSCLLLSLHRLSYVQIRKEGSESLSNFASNLHLIRAEMNLELVPDFRSNVTFFSKLSLQIKLKRLPSNFYVVPDKHMPLKMIPGCDIAHMLNRGSKGVNKCQKERRLYSQNFKIVSKISPTGSIFLTS